MERPSTGSAKCPKCDNNCWFYEQGNFRCSVCKLLVNAIAQPIKDKESKNYANIQKLRT